ncbi:cyclic nucleotide-binding domain-containing protein [Spirochaeta isovalerica]|uniref:CRP-like cAMP-binding protein n=1 Tax=Spirochaeta isovalerica TaxID=150 RepID=A0A841R7R4_9SPIO|nr:CRP-like cAMP-binding protein [Spirochaeta isovalerica]
MEQEWLDLWHRILKERQIPEREWERFSQLVKFMTMKKGEFLIREGDMPDKVAFIASGMFRAFYTTDEGDEKTIVFRGTGRPLSAYSSHLENKEAKFSIEALEESSLLYLSIQNFEKLLSANPFWKEVTALYYMNLFIEKEKRERELMSDDAETRYNNFLREYPGLIDRINHYHIASYLGITNVTLSRIRRRQTTLR